MTDITYANGLNGNPNQFNNQGYGYGINNTGTVVGDATARSTAASAFVISGGSMLTIDDA